MHRTLRTLWNEPRPAQLPPRTWRDWALVFAFVAVAVLEAATRRDLPWRVLATVVTLGLTPTLLWRRTHPMPMVAIAFAVTGLAPLATDRQPLNMYSMVYILTLPYSLTRWGSGRSVVIGSAVLVANSTLWLAAGYATLDHAFGQAAILVTALALGAAFRYRARARTRDLDQAKLLERERLARDLHDTVAHHVTAMAVRAQAGLVVAESRPEAATEALRLIDDEASRALTEMRTIVRVLRRDRPAELAPGPRIADVEQLAREGTGPVVDVEISGEVEGVSEAVAAAVYRLAQEAVTNARRHARHATRVEVRVTADAASIRLRVSDDGEAVRPRTGSPGYGLVGMAERAGLLGGTCEAGPDPTGGWTVTAVLPRTGSAA